MAVVTQIELNYYDRRLKELHLRIYTDDGGGPCITSFGIDTPTGLYTQLHDFLEHTLNPALKSENIQTLNLDKLNRNKVTSYFKTLIELIKKINDLKPGIKEYIEIEEQLNGFSVYLSEIARQAIREKIIILKKQEGLTHNGACC